MDGSKCFFFNISVSSRKGLSPGGKLYKIDDLQTPVVIEDDLYGGAGMAWTEDYKYFYLVDNHLGCIHKYDFNSDAGTISTYNYINVDYKQFKQLFTLTLILK